MAAFRGVVSVKNCTMRTLNFSTSNYVSNKWRRMQGLEPSPRRFSPLTNLPDYSFLDGRPTPLSYFKKKKIEQQAAYCKRIVELTEELDVGLKLYYERLKNEEEKKQAILKNKLKPKGAALLKKRNHSES